MTKVLITDPIDQSGIDILSQVAQVDQKIGLSDADLADIIKESSNNKKSSSLKSFPGLISSGI